MGIWRAIYTPHERRGRRDSPLPRAGLREQASVLESTNAAVIPGMYQECNMRNARPTQGWLLNIPVRVRGCHKLNIVYVRTRSRSYHSPVPTLLLLLML